MTLLSVIVPTLNEATALGRTLEALSRVRGPLEVLVVDGGSSDGTAALARRHGAHVMVSERGIGPQLHS
jgi:glycosyltransferase involved in cell wall biosynthesis